MSLGKVDEQRTGQGDGVARMISQLSCQCIAVETMMQRQSAAVQKAWQQRQRESAERAQRQSP